MIQFKLDSITQVAAYQTWSGGISRLVIGEEEVSRFIEDSKDSFARLYLFTDVEFAEKEYQRDWDDVYLRGSAYQETNGYWYGDPRSPIMDIHEANEKNDASV
jgi:hypothetical protein